jgi:molybdate transport system substrate-binding protein
MIKLIKTLLMVTGFIAHSVLANPPTVVVAANMKPAIDEIYQEYKQATGQSLRIIYGSSGNFMRQIQQGAPFHLFISADENFPLVLSKQGLTLDDGKVYAIGRLAMIAHRAKKITLSLDEASFQKIIQDANKIAIAKPEVAPYGRAAAEVLENMKLQAIARKKYVYGENIAAATNYVITGAADVGFTAYSLAKSKEVSGKINYQLIPDHLHQPIRQRMVLIKSAPQEVVQFYNHLQGEKARRIIQAHGYSLP